MSVPCTALPIVSECLHLFINDQTLSVAGPFIDVVAAEVKDNRAPEVLRDAHLQLSLVDPDQVSAQVGISSPRWLTVTE